MNRRCFPVLALALAALASAQTPFVRMKKPSATVEVLQTKARQYVPTQGGGPTIWLVGVAHIGNAAYYREIQKLLDEQTVVLYEGVKRKNQEDGAKMSSTYQMLSDALGLQFQLYGIDYKRSSFKNSDLSWEEMQAIEAKNPTPKGGMNLATIGNVLDADSSQGKQLAAVLKSMKDDPGSIEGMHLMMVEMLSDPNAMDMAMPKDLSKLLIQKRNTHVLGDLKKELTARPKSIAIFFGAGHMADMEKHLINDFHYKPGEERWFDAIEGDTSKLSSQGKTMLEMMRSVMASKRKGG